MKVRIGSDASANEATAIGKALISHLDEAVVVFAGDNVAVRIDRDGSVEELDAETAMESGVDRELTDREATLLAEIADIEAGGPQRHRDRLGDQGKLFVRDRLALWFGPEGLRFEDGKFANFDAWHPHSPDVDEPNDDDRLPADGMITGVGVFEGRQVHVAANDYTVKAGSIASRGVEKFLRLQERALDTGRPLIYLTDSSGGRIDQQSGFFANREGIGKFYFNHSMLSGRVPQICVLYGPCIAGAAYTPVFADFTIMVRGMSAMAIASPRMVEMVTGEDISLEDLGGPDVHMRHSGSADLVASDEEHARELVAELIRYLPDNASENPPRASPAPPGESPEDLDSVIPTDPHRGYDVRSVIDRLVDRDSFFELRPEFGGEIVTAYARIDGRPVGIIANQPATRAGAIFPDGAEKAAEFIWKSDAFNVPLLYLCDTPGFMAGSQVEREGILEKGKKMIYATSSATVPKLCVVVRKAYGAGIYAMAGPAYEPESTIALPSGEIAIMGPEAAINAVYARKLADFEEAGERNRVEQELREEYREEIDVHRMASEVVIDDIVAPSTLRDELADRFAFYETVEKRLPEKKHGTVL